MANLTIDFFSLVLHRPVQFKMVIPNDLNPAWNPEQKRKTKKMKTLFLLHGYEGAAGNWIPENLPALYNFAVVMPNGENGFYTDGLSTGHQYATFVAEELLGYVRKTFNLAMTREDTYIMGYSMGGYGALRTALAYPDRFSKTVGLSSALIVRGCSTMKPGESNPIANYEYYRECFGELSEVLTSRNNPEVLVDEILTQNKKMPEIYMACGFQDFLINENRTFHKYLEDKKVPHKYCESEGIHDMNFWREYAEKFIPMLFEDDLD